MLGKSGVGKTTLIYKKKYGGTGLSSYNATIGSSFLNFDVALGSRDQLVQLQVWDTAGQERFRCMVPMYVRNAGVAVIVYDITERKSFEEIDRWIVGKRVEKGIKKLNFHNQK